MNEQDSLALEPLPVDSSATVSALADTLSVDSLAVDSLSIDSLDAVEKDTALVELIGLDDCSYFCRDTFFHADVPYRPYGFQSTSSPFRFRNDAWSGFVLLLCLLLTAGLLVRLRKKFKETVQGVLFPIPGKKEEPLVDDPLRLTTRILAIALLSISAAVVTFTYTQADVGFYLFRETPYLLFAAFLLLWIVYFVAKQLMVNFVNWVFFRQEKIFTFGRVYTFFYVVEAMLIFVLSLAVAYLPFRSDEVLILTISVVLIVKILYLFKTFSIFFPKWYGSLHLIVYFCTLEMMPLVILWHILPYAECLFTIKII